MCKTKGKLYRNTASRRKTIENSCDQPGLLFGPNLYGIGARHGILFADHAVKHLGDICHDRFVHGNAGVKAEALAVGAVEDIVGVAAGCAQTVWIII